MYLVRSFLCLITLSKSTKLMDLDCKPCETSIYEHGTLLIDDNVVSQGEGKKLGQINLA